MTRQPPAADGEWRGREGASREVNDRTETMNANITTTRLTFLIIYIWIS